MRFRVATPEDVESVVALGDVDPGIRGYIKQGFVHLAVDDLGIVAACAAIPTDRKTALASMVVRQGERGKGVGRKLFRHLERVHPGGLLAVSAPDAEGFWASLGFAPTMRVMEK